MSVSRKQALKFLVGILPRVQEHLRMIMDDPASAANDHWRKEVRTWLRDMEDMLPHVGHKTGASWRAAIGGLREQLGEQS